MDQLKPKIPVIDDEKGLRGMLVCSLTGRGYAVTTASQALALEVGADDNGRGGAHAA